MYVATSINHHNNFHLPPEWLISCKTVLDIDTKSIDRGGTMRYQMARNPLERTAVVLPFIVA
jgi:hypothetical protein